MIYQCPVLFDSENIQLPRYPNIPRFSQPREGPQPTHRHAVPKRSEVNLPTLQSPFPGTARDISNNSALGSKHREGQLITFNESRVLQASPETTELLNIRPVRWTPQSFQCCSTPSYWPRSLVAWWTPLGFAPGVGAREHPAIACSDAVSIPL